MLAVDTADRINQPPILVYPLGDPPVNTTFTVTQGSLPDGEPLTVYQYWYFWPGCALSPTSPLCKAGHIANDWEPIYIYWKTTDPLFPVLLYVYVRAHFAWTPVPGSLVSLNGTQIIVTFSSAFHVPLVDTRPLSQLIKSGNSSISFPFNQNAQPPFVPGTWYYPVTNGGPHTLFVWLDPASPPGAGPTAYENDAAGNAGPADPFGLLGDSSGLAFGLLGGLVTTVAVYGFFAAIEIDYAGFKKVLSRRR